MQLHEYHQNSKFKAIWYIPILYDKIVIKVYMYTCTCICTHIVYLLLHMYGSQDSDSICKEINLCISTSRVNNKLHFKALKKNQVHVQCKCVYESVYESVHYCTCTVCVNVSVCLYTLYESVLGLGEMFEYWNLRLFAVLLKQSI